MRRTFLPLVIAAALAVHSTARGATDAEVAARRAALDLAGAFSNDGFKLRDGSWTGQLFPGKAQLIQVNLYAGNQYWFSLGASAEAKRLVVSIFDEAGNPVVSEPLVDGATAAAGFAPEASGPYYIKVETLEGAAAGACLLYSYK